jgi:hypothetical protein
MGKSQTNSKKARVDTREIHAKDGVFQYVDIGFGAKFTTPSLLETPRIARISALLHVSFETDATNEAHSTT